MCSKAQVGSAALSKERGPRHQALGIAHVVNGLVPAADCLVTSTGRGARLRHCIEAFSKPVENLESTNLIAYAPRAELKTTSLPRIATGNGYLLTDKAPMNVVEPKSCRNKTWHLLLMIVL